VQGLNTSLGRRKILKIETKRKGLIENSSLNWEKANPAKQIREKYTRRRAKPMDSKNEEEAVRFGQPPVCLRIPLSRFFWSFHLSSSGVFK